MEDKYQKGKIYMITDIGYNKFYYGSTIQPLSARMARHRALYKMYKEGRYHNMTVYSLFDEFGVEKCKIELVENCPCSSKEELQKREGYYIKHNDAVNRCVAGRTTKEWCTDNKERLQEYNKQNKVKLQEKGKRYYMRNAERIREKRHELHLCSVCGKPYTLQNKARHDRSNFHTQQLVEVV
jgi:hypothetical protein